ncbi:3'-5' exonuclease [Moheibacter lacus]|uniref:3'-5' exonuclease n=1 Tax=Moheibacter lacus TaxID=2745851 RepID=A0A838ZNC9_9FLAO|nr:3'-5' exonuclease [Moheibacter lacus]MBA5629186.1 3'-5' exonuclease [Moheibacter lacus]
MLKKIPSQKVLFLDIETVPEVGNWSELSDEWKDLWAKKIDKQLTEDETAEEFYGKRAGILAEFGKIICISCGIIVENDKIHLKSFYGDNESQILKDFNELINGKYFDSNVIFCAHNGKEFDFPYMARRMIINEIELPPALDLQGKKPWEIPHLDTMELWKFGDYKHYTSLNLLAAVLGIPTPKDDIDGSQVASVYYDDHDLGRIKTYCEKDVLTVAQIFRKFRGENLLERK